MKTLVITLMAVVLIALTWISLGWTALLVIPSLALFALMSFTPLLTAWAQDETSGENRHRIEPSPSAEAGVKKQSTPAGSPC